MSITPLSVPSSVAESPRHEEAINGLAKEGDSVEAQIWHGSIVVLRDRGVESATMDRPGISGLVLLYILGSGVCLGVALFGVLCPLPD